MKILTDSLDGGHDSREGHPIQRVHHILQIRLPQPLCRSSRRRLRLPGSGRLQVVGVLVGQFEAVVVQHAVQDVEVAQLQLLPHAHVVAAQVLIDALHQRLQGQLGGQQVRQRGSHDGGLLVVVAGEVCRAALVGFVELGVLQHHNSVR
jgi:hypothetical protein